MPIEHWPRCPPSVMVLSPFPFATRLNPRSAEALGRLVQVLLSILDVSHELTDDDVRLLVEEQAGTGPVGQ